MNIKSIPRILMGFHVEIYTPVTDPITGKILKDYSIYTEYSRKHHVYYGAQMEHEVGTEVSERNEPVTLEEVTEYVDNMIEDMNDSDIDNYIFYKQSINERPATLFRDYPIIMVRITIYKKEAV